MAYPPLLDPILSGVLRGGPLRLGHLFFAPAGPRGSENEYALRDERHRGVHPHGSRDLLVLDVGALAVGGIVAGVVGDLHLFCPAGWSAHPNRYRAPQRHLHCAILSSLGLAPPIRHAHSHRAGHPTDSSHPF